MFILKDLNNVVISSGNEIDYGIFDEPNLNKWKIVNDVCLFYVLGDNLFVEEVQNLPFDYKDYQYCYTEEKGFYKNDNYIDPINTEEEVKRLTKENLDLKAQFDKVQEVLDYLVMQ